MTSWSADPWSADIGGVRVHFLAHDHGGCAVDHARPVREDERRRGEPGDVVGGDGPALLREPDGVATLAGADI